MKRNFIPVLFAIALMASSCATGGGSSSAPASGGDAAAADAAPADQSIPADSPLAKIEKGMADTDVRRILGEPTSSKSYMTGKQFIPWYFGTDTRRTEYTYAGMGSVILSRNQYTGGLSVVSVHYDPSKQ